MESLEKPTPTRLQSLPKGKQEITNWKEWWDRHPLKLIVGIAGTVVVSTASVCSYFASKHLEAQKASDVLALQRTKSDDDAVLEKTKKEDQAQLDEMKSRFALTTRRVGDRSVWDLSNIVVTPDQAKTLGPSYIYHEEIHSYLSVPKSSSWSFIETTEEGLWHMIYGNEPNLSWETEAFLEVGKTQGVYVWRGADSFRVNSTNPEKPVICVFSFVSIEEVNNKVVSKLDLLTNMLEQRFGAYFQSVFTKLDSQIDLLAKAFNQDLARYGLGPMALRTPPPHSAEQFRGLLFKANESNVQGLTADSASYWAGMEMLSGFQHSKEVPKSSFLARNAEKQGRVFHLSYRFVFPASDATPDIYWDQEQILVSTGKTTLCVTVSDPWSPNQRSTAQPLINSLLAGLKVPCE